MGSHGPGFLSKIRLTNYNNFTYQLPYKDLKYDVEMINTLLIMIVGTVGKDKISHLKEI